MRIAHILRRFSFTEWGGTETVVWSTARKLAGMGHDQTIFATRACSEVGDEVREGLPIRRLGYFYPCFPMIAWRRIALDKKGGDPVVPGLGRAVRGGGFDLLHLHTGGRMAQAAVQAARGVPYVMTFHGGCYDVPPSELEEMLRPTRGILRYGRIVDALMGWRRDLLAGAAGLICLGKAEEAMLRQHYPDANVVLLPNGVEPTRFREPPTVDARERLGIPPGRKLILCVSRIDYQKDQKFAVSALAELCRQGEDVHLLLIGPVSVPRYGEELRALIQEQGMEARVTIVAGLPAGDPLLMAAYRQADVFLLPSRHEPFGIVVLEAWSAGLPVIASAVGGLRDLVEDGVDGLAFQPGDLASFLDAWRRLPARRDALIAAATRKVDGQYTWDAIAARLASFYGQIAARRVKP